jgi:hypothetical protein
MSGHKYSGFSNGGTIYCILRNQRVLFHLDWFRNRFNPPWRSQQMGNSDLDSLSNCYGGINCRNYLCWVLWSCCLWWPNPQLKLNYFAKFERASKIVVGTFFLAIWGQLLISILLTISCLGIKSLKNYLSNGPKKSFEDNFRSPLEFSKVDQL